MTGTRGGSWAARSGSAVLAGLLAGLVMAVPVGAAPGDVVEVGPNDFRISEMGGTGNLAYDATDPAVAYNPTADEYLVVWSADEEGGGFANEELEIFGQRLDGDGSPLGGQIRVSDAGGTGNADYDAVEPAAVYDPDAGQYLVVWRGEDFGLAANENEVFGQRLSATGDPLGENDFRISDAGDTGDSSYDALAPAVAYNTDAGEFLVVWYGNDIGGGLHVGEFEIFGQRLTAAGLPTGVNDFRISDVGGTGVPDYDAVNPAITYNADASAYLVVWSANDNEGGMVVAEHEIFGQLLSGGGAEMGVDFRVSDAGDIGDALYDASDPAVTSNSHTGEFLVVWRADDNVDGLVPGEFEVFGQRFSSAGVAVGTNDFRVSDMGGSGEGDYDAHSPAVAQAAGGGYMVVWHGNDDIDDLVLGESEVFAQRLSETGAEQGGDYRVSDAGGSGDSLFNASEAAVSFRSGGGEFLVVWQADDNVGGLVDGEDEVFGQRLSEEPVIDPDPDPDPDPEPDPENDAGESVYALVTRQGDVHAFPESFYVGDPDLPVGVEAVDIVLSPTHEKGYYVLGSDGRVYPVGDGLADFGGIDLALLPQGDTPSELLVYPEESGATVFTRRGGAFGLGDAPELENLYHLDLVGDVVSMTLHEFGGWGAGEDGGVFTYNDVADEPGTVPFCGSLYDELAPGVVPNSAVTTIYATEGCYTMLGAKGGVYNFGGSPYYGSLYEPEYLGPDANTLLVDTIVTGTRVIGAADVLFGSSGGVFVINADHDDPDFEFQGSVVGKLGHLLPADNLIVAGDAHTT